jgi:N-acetylglutamate synthase-like GNAT family acetyltransferase
VEFRKAMKKDIDKIMNIIRHEQAKGLISGRIAILMRK